jgi:hypothetical protein
MKQIDNYDNRISLLIENWLELKKELTELFEKRDRKNALEPMKKGIEIFLHFLLWCNEIESFDNEETIGNLKWKPVNVTERLSFIKTRPDLYHSFIQLTELMTEQEKQFNIKIAIKK